MGRLMVTPMTKTRQDVFWLLSQEIPLRRFSIFSLKRGTILHHFGVFDISRDSLDIPLWVSDDLGRARASSHIGVGATHHTTMALKEPLVVSDLSSVNMRRITGRLMISSRDEWNSQLAGYLRKNRAQAIMCANRQIFLPLPLHIVSRAFSTSIHHA